jgi:hypothetical protein
MWQINARLRGLVPGRHELRLRTSHSHFSEPAYIERIEPD